MKSSTQTNGNDLSELQKENEALKQQLNQAKEKNTWWEEQFKLLRQRRFGKSKDAAPGQSDLFDDIETPLPEEDSTETKTQTITYTREVKIKGRLIDTSKLPRETVIHDLPEDARQCACCDGELHKIGEDKSEELIYIPSRNRRLVHNLLIEKVTVAKVFAKTLLS